ncbi:MAG: HAD-IA family hydrolase [Treponema sp.]|jgi:putative hydrolase of the HAD superfamily|nr:HAD-IA family hydrolase [Treponema sp.]
MLKYLLFDLDNTLYSARYGLEDAVSRRILAFLTRYLGVPAPEAARERRIALKKHGTTLEWLMAEKGFTGVDAYYAEIHPEGEASALEPDPALRDFLEGVPLPKAILTNAPLEHAVRILDKLRVRDCFTHIFDMRRNNFVGKPAPETFRRVLDALGVTPAETLFVDDYPFYVDGYRALGGQGVLFDEKNAHPDYPPPRIGDLRELGGFLGPL